MLAYIIRRLLGMIPTLLVISMLVFVIIQLPPGDYLESYIAELESQGESVDEQKIAFLREEYGLDRPLYEQYFVWVTGMLQGDFGYSFEYSLPVTEVVGDRLFLTVLISVVTIIFHLDDRFSYWHLFRNPSIQLGRLQPLISWFPWSGNT